MTNVLIPRSPYQARPGENSPILHVARHTYGRKAEKYGAGVVHVSMNMTHGQIRAVFDKGIHAYFGTGGPDIHPKVHGQSLHPKTIPAPEGQDEFDIFVLQQALDRELPVFVTCRTFQLLNVVLGGILNQHIPDRVPEERERHHLGEGEGYDGLPNSGHAVHIVPGSKTHEILGGKENIRVNSGHHQEVITLGQGLELGGESPEKVKEIATNEDGSVIGVQFHGEAEENGDAEPLYQHFFHKAHTFAAAARSRISFSLGRVADIQL